MRIGCGYCDLNLLLPRLPGGPTGGGGWTVKKATRNAAPLPWLSITPAEAQNRGAQNHVSLR